MSALVLSLPVTNREPPPPGDQPPREPQTPPLPHPPQRTTLADLPPAGRLVVWTLRALGESQNNWPIVQQELWLCCGPVTIEAVLQGLDEVLRALALHGRHPTSVGAIADQATSGDELALLGLLAAAQADDAARLDALCLWLVRASGRQALITQGRRLADGLMRSGLDLRPSAPQFKDVSARDDAASSRKAEPIPPAGA